MDNKCCHNGCRGNVTPEGISRQRFPMNHIMKSRWLRAIFRENWVPSKNSVACSLNCHDFDFVTDKADSNIIRGINKEKLTKRRPCLPLYWCQYTSQAGGRMGKAWKDVNGTWKGRWQWGTGKGLLLGGFQR